MDAANTLGEWIARKMRSQRAYVGERGRETWKQRKMAKASLALPIHLGYKEGVPMLAGVQLSAIFQLPSLSYTQSFYEVKKVFSLVDTPPRLVQY